jgi:hypothetical protein
MWNHRLAAVVVMAAALCLPGLAQTSTNTLRVRVVAANLTSSNDQSYSPSNGNHSNPEGAGARILKGLKPDIVLIQEFNCTIQLSQWISETFGTSPGRGSGSRMVATCGPSASTSRPETAKASVGRKQRPW